MPITRILSDLHYGHPATAIGDLRQITPLLEGVERVVFNGDSVEMRFVREYEQGAADFARLQAFCAEAGTEGVFLTGNHDPALTPLHHLDLHEGAVFVTHGDALFHGLSPWSREAEALKAAHSQCLADAGHPSALEPLLAAARKAALAIETLGPFAHHHAHAKTFAGFIRQIWPPWRPFKMIECWIQAPGWAAAFAEQHRPNAKCFLFGHTHRAGIWRRRGRTLINTGSFLPYSGMLLADLDGGELAVRKIERRGRDFYPGAVVRGVKLD